MGWDCCWRAIPVVEPLAEPGVDSCTRLAGGGVGLDSRETFIVQVSIRAFGRKPGKAY